MALEMKEIKTWDDKKVNSKINDIKTELFKMRMQRGTSGMEKPHRVKELRQDIARLMTTKNLKSETK